MSIEIEVGLENATRIPIPLEEPTKPAPKGLANPRVQRLLMALRHSVCQRTDAVRGPMLQ